MLASVTLAALTASLWPASLHAAPAARVRCESKDGRWQHCRLPDGKGDVTLLRQISRNPCIRNNSWGLDEEGLWVARGCRAEFGREGVIDAADNPTSTRKRQLRCESRGHGMDHCPIDIAGSVRLTRQLSRMDCELGESWGYDAKGVWVARGCGAEFEVETASRRSTRWLGRLLGRDEKAPAATATMGRPLRCESIDGQRKECRSGGATRVELVRQLSRASCQIDKNWGWDSQRVWVSRGCRAEFLLW